MGLKPSDEEISAILSEIDVTYNGQMEIQDYLQVDGPGGSTLLGACAPTGLSGTTMGSMFIAIKMCFVSMFGYLKGCRVAH